MLCIRVRWMFSNFFCITDFYDGPLMQYRDAITKKHAVCNVVRDEDEAGCVFESDFLN